MTRQELREKSLPFLNYLEDSLGFDAWLVELFVEFIEQLLKEGIDG